MNGGIATLWNKERLGLTLIIASVAVIGITTYQLLKFESDTRLKELRIQGSTISRILADVPFSDLQARRDDHGPLRMLQLGQDADEFAYAVVTDQSGNIKNAVNAPAIDVNTIAVGIPAGAWSGEREIALPVSGETVTEFFAPVVEGSEVVGAVRVGYLKPVPGIDSDQVPFFATLALTIFLLTPFFYLAVRREIKPMQAVNREISDRVNDGRFNACTIEATGELAEFVNGFNQFTDVVRSKIETLEHDNNELLTNQKLLSYHKLRVESVLKAIPSAIMIIDQNGRVSYANEKIGSILGVNPDAIIGSKTSEWCDREEVVSFLARFEETSTRNSYSETLRFDRSDAGNRKLSMKAYPLFSPQNPEVIFARMVIFADVTKEVLAEEGRANFIAHVAHELKTPLNTLSLYAEALQSESGQDENFRVEAFNVINDEVERLAALVDNMLNITKIEMGNLKIEKQRVRLQDLLRDVFENIHQNARNKQLKFHIDIPKELSTLSLDKDLLRIALNNLLVNAVKYTNAGGHVLLKAEETDSAIEIRVRDTGMGIAPEYLEKIFEKFYRVASPEMQDRAGHGLGLALAKEIIELHGGSLSVNSELGKGSEFVISLVKMQALMREAI